MQFHAIKRQKKHTTKTPIKCTLILWSQKLKSGSCCFILLMLDNNRSVVCAQKPPLLLRERAQLQIVQNERVAIHKKGNRHASACKCIYHRADSTEFVCVCFHFGAINHQRTQFILILQFVLTKCYKFRSYGAFEQSAFQFVQRFDVLDGGKNYNEQTTKIITQSNEMKRTTKKKEPTVSCTLLRVKLPETLL